MSDALGSDRVGGRRGAGATGAGGGEVPRGIAAAIAAVSERATLLVREEIELAKAEITEKATRLAKGAVIGIAAGIFFVTALFFFLIGCAWLLYYYLPGNAFTYFWGFFAMAAILLVLGVLAGLIAARAVKRGAPPTPDMAIEEARLIRETVSAPEPGARGAAPTGASASASTSTAAPAPREPVPAHIPTIAAAAPTAAPGGAGVSAPAPYGAAAAHAPAPAPQTEDAGGQQAGERDAGEHGGQEAG